MSTLPTFGTHTAGAIPLSFFERPGGGPAVIFLHGLGSTKLDFQAALFDRELQHCRLIGFDLPGCGASPWLGDSGLDAIATAIAEALERWQVQSPVVVGHSLGGAIGLLLCERRPARAFVNIEGNLDPGDCALLSRPGVKAGRGALRERALDAVTATLINAPDLGARLFAANLRRNVDTSAYFEYCAALVHLCDTGDLLRRFIELPLEKTFVVGEANRSLPYVPRLAAAGVRVVEIPETGHWPHLTHPAMVMATIVDRVTEADAQSFNLSERALPFVPEGALAGRTELRMLDIAHNRLTAIPSEIGERTEVTGYLYIGDNRLSSFPQSLARLKRLRYLNFSDNRIDELPDDIGELISLQELRMDRNGLRSLPEAIGNLSSLRELHAGGNQISALPDSMAGLSSLRVLNLRNNRLESLPGWIAYLPSLAQLDLRNNRLTDLPEELVTTPRLEKLDLRWNPLPTIPDWFEELERRGCSVHY
jgi:pimeloyl-ACP methyl ester carboxylesterase